MFNLIVKVFWLFLPAGLANMAPVLFRWLPFLNKPIDFNFTFKGKRIFGEHKTWQGILVGILMALVVVEIQNFIYPLPVENIFLWGLTLGGGALIGDLIKSFLKRQLNIAPGKSWFLADQIDWILGALIFSSLLYFWFWQEWLAIIILFGILHPITNLFGCWLKIKPNKF